MSKPEPTLRLRVDAQALADNWRALDRLSGSAKAGAAVKANCYGLGVDACLPALRDAGWTDVDIWDISAVASFFNMSNRMASAIDMQPNPEYHGQFR